MSTKLIYPAAFYPLESSSGYCVEVPDLPGCVTEGKDLENALDMAVDAASGWILTALENGQPIPSASDPSCIHPDEDCKFISLLVLDIDDYCERYGQKAVRKNCTIPAWLNTIAEKENINYSALLQDALKQKFHIA